MADCAPAKDRRGKDILAQGWLNVGSMFAQCSTIELIALPPTYLLSYLPNYLLVGLLTNRSDFFTTEVIQSLRAFRLALFSWFGGSVVLFGLVCLVGLVGLVCFLSKCKMIQ